VAGFNMTKPQQSLLSTEFMSPICIAEYKQANSLLLERSPLSVKVLESYDNSDFFFRQHFFSGTFYFENDLDTVEFAVAT
jgi:hypothetical protein